MRRLFVVCVVVAAALAFSASAFADSLVTVGSPLGPFAQNKQNEPGVAMNAVNPMMLAAGSNDEIDLEACAAGDPTTCPFTSGVGVSGIYFSFNGGLSWTQPTYTGWTARDCLGPAACVPHVGPIGTLPWYYENGLVSDGDPTLAFGPKPGAAGFSWANGYRLYYANLTSNFSAVRSEEAFKGFEAAAVSRTDNIAAAAANDKGAWMQPVIVSKQNAALFSDKETIWADNAASSPFFGNVYLCNAAFRSQELSPNAVPEPIIFSRSSDGGATWQTRQISPATNNILGFGRQDCTVRTDSHGTVYVFWQGGILGNPQASATTGAIWMTRSSDGGQTFSRPQIVATFIPCGQFDAITGRFSFDGVAGARTGTEPLVDIANGAPTGSDATNAIVLTYCNGPTPTVAAPGPNEQALVRVSVNGGASWSAPVNAAEATDRPDFPSVAVAPNGSTVYVAYDAFLQPWQSTTLSPRLMQGVVRAASLSGATLGGFTTRSRGGIGDARGSSQNGLTAEFLGDYNNAAASRTFGVAVYNDTRNAADCAAIDAYRQALVSGTTATRPAPNSDCPFTFGNSDIYAANVTP